MSEQSSPQSVELVCRDGHRLRGRWWPADPPGDPHVVVVAPATGVQASYYSRYAGWLAQQGLSCLTFDYRGIGASREPALGDRSVRWYTWGDQDLDAALAWALDRCPGARAGAAFLTLPLEVDCPAPGSGMGARAGVEQNGWCGSSHSSRAGARGGGLPPLRRP